MEPFKTSTIDEIQTIKNLNTQYLDFLQKDIENNEREQDKITSEIEEINKVIENIKCLSQRPEWPESFIPINSLAYVPATLIHTGEHYVKLGSEAYSLMSLHETLDYLQRQLKCKQDLQRSYTEHHAQLQQRIKLCNRDELDEAEDTTDMPLEISSDKGVALKTTIGYYEVLEPYNEATEKEFYDKRRKIKTKDKEHPKELDPDEYFKRLDELQKQEFLNEESIDLDVAGNINSTNLCEHVKSILKTSGAYTKLLADDFIKQQCTDKCELDSDSTLNKLIIAALLEKPVGYCSTQNTAQSSFNCNELKVIEFLDNIEKDVES